MRRVSLPLCCVHFACVCVCMCVCVCVCVCVWVCMCVCVWERERERECVCENIYVNIHGLMSANAPRKRAVFFWFNLPVWVWVCVCVCMRMCFCVWKCPHTSSPACSHRSSLNYLRHAGLELWDLSHSPSGVMSAAGAPDSLVYLCPEASQVLETIDPNVT